MPVLASLIDYTPISVGVSTATLLAISMLRSNRLNQYADRLGKILSSVAFLQLLSAIGVAAVWLLSGQTSQTFELPFGDQLPVVREFGLLLDGPTVLMFGLTSFIGWVIIRYSQRYLQGDAQQGRFFKQLSFTLAWVNLLVWSSSLTLFTLAWFGVSMGLHGLLMHFHERQGAKRAAWLKLVISRCGELLLLAAIVILLSAFGTAQFSQIASYAQSQLESAYLSSPMSTSLTAACWLVVIAAIIKTAQFPFHAWLPQTLETPTPVSALMHAGVVNAGGFLMIRTGTWFNAAPTPLVLLTLVGTVTAVYGAVVMSTQSSVKRQLAFSTVAQMGFMMLQCGLGAFSVAMLHILAHSLYKAHAFLASGSVLQDRQATDVPVANGHTSRLSLLDVAVIVPATLLLFSTGAFAMNVLIAAKVGAWPLLMFWGIGIAYYVGKAIQTWNPTTAVRALLVSGVLTNLYAGSIWLMQQGFVNSATQTLNPSSLSLLIVLSGLIVLLISQFGLTSRLNTHSPMSNWRAAFYVHASNGFYFESLWRRLSPFRLLGNS